MTTDHTIQQPAPDSVQIGSFSGYARRPKPSLSGMVAQFFGENGEDADTISALSLTKFQDTEVLVRVFWVKNSDGSLMKDSASALYPLICSFTGHIRRPNPMRDGMTAQFFSHNGENADAINELGKSKYLDSLVFVEVFKPKAPSRFSQSSAGTPNVEEQAPEPTASLDAVAGHLTPLERKVIERENKARHEANRQLKISGFLRQAALWACLGAESDYRDWLASAPCCGPGDNACPNNPPNIFHFTPGSNRQFMFLPLCQAHILQAQAGTLSGGEHFLSMRQTILIQEWAWDRLCSAVGLEQGFTEPSPQKVMSWAVDNKVSQYVPSSYLNKF